MNKSISCQKLSCFILGNQYLYKAILETRVSLPSLNCRSKRVLRRLARIAWVSFKLIDAKKKGRQVVKRL